MFQKHGPVLYFCYNNKEEKSNEDYKGKVNYCNKVNFDCGNEI